MNSKITSVDRHKEITLLFLKHAALRTAKPDVEGARRLARDLENLGPAFVRAARALSFRGDLLPAAFLEAFSEIADVRICDDEQEIEPLESLEKIIEDELGKKIARAFASFHSEPSGFSGIGQIHHATLHDGRQVTVRIQRPQLRQRIVRDLDTLAEIAAFIDHPSGRGRHHKFSRLVDRHRVTLMRELDYRREEVALEELREKLEGFRRVKVPAVVHEFCSSRILTTELVDGSEIWEIPSRENEQARDLAEQFLGCYLDQILVHGQVHPEPHLENILITADGDLVITEASGMLKIGTASRSMINFLLTGICSGDAVSVSEAALRLGHQVDDGAVLDRTGMLGEMRAALQAGNIADRLHAIARSASVAGYPFNAEVCRLGDVLIKLARITEAISPKFDAEDFIRNYLRQHVRETETHTVRFFETSAA